MDDKQSFAGKTAISTGAASGMGLLFAQNLPNSAETSCFVT